MKRVTPEEIKILEDDEIFVFGSNSRGYHGAGAAVFAAECGYPMGVSQALDIDAQCMGIVTVNSLGNKFQSTPKAMPTLDELKQNVDRAIETFKTNPKLNFLVTEIGCGLAGFAPMQIAWMFHECINMPNVALPKRFWMILNAEAYYHLSRTALMTLRDDAEGMLGENPWDSTDTDNWESQLEVIDTVKNHFVWT